MKVNFIKSFVKIIKKKGPLFTILFLFLFSLCVIPLVVLFFVALSKALVVGTIVFLILIGMILFEIKTKHLYQLVLLIVILNLALWFILGLLSYVKDIFSWLPGVTAYLLMAPYALFSGYVVFYLLWKASSNNAKKTLYGGVIVSTMMAIIAAMTNLIIIIGRSVQSQIKTVENITGISTSGLSTLFGNTFYNPLVGFLILFVFFNVPFIRLYLTKNKRYYLLVLYLIPIVFFLVLVVILKV